MSTKSQPSLMNYVNEVAQFFLARFPHISVLGPDDYTLIAEWEKEEIPLEIAFRAFEKPVAGDEADINSIVQFNESVETSFRDWLQTQNLN